MMLEKVAAILEVAKQPVLKDHIMTKCDLSSLTFNKYMTILLQNGLVNAYPALDLHMPGRKTRHRMIYQTSQKGTEFLKKYNELLSLMEIPLNHRVEKARLPSWVREDFSFSFLPQPRRELSLQNRSIPTL